MPDINSAISFVDFAERSASFLTSSATTAKPSPCSPALAASIAAFRARRFVCSAISSMTSTILPMSSALAPSAAIVSAECVMALLISSVPMTDLFTASRPASTALLVFFDSSTSCCAVFAILCIEVTICSIEADVCVTDDAWPCELFATFWMFADISCIVAVVSSTAVAVASLFLAACSAVDAISAEADAIWSPPDLISVIIPLNPASIFLKALPSMSFSDFGITFPVRSPSAISSAVLAMPFK